MRANAFSRGDRGYDVRLGEITPPDETLQCGF